MKFYEITFETMIQAVRNRWKTVLLTVLGFAVLGAGFGFAASRAGDIVGAGRADTLALLELPAAADDKDYYFDYASSIHALCDDAELYLEKLSEETTLTEEQQALVMSLQEELSVWKEDCLTEIEGLGMNAYRPCVPEAFVSQEKDLCEAKLLDFGAKRDAAQMAADLLESMESAALAQTGAEDAYEELVKTAAALPEYQRVADIFEARLEWLDAPDEMFANARRLDELLADGADSLNALVGKVNAAAQAIAEESHLIIHMHVGHADRGYSELEPNVASEEKEESKKPGEEEKVPLKIGIEHSFGISYAKDAFLVIALFCTLVGLCAGAFWALCKECRASKPL